MTSEMDDRVCILWLTTANDIRIDDQVCILWLVTANDIPNGWQSVYIVISYG